MAGRALVVRAAALAALGLVPTHRSQRPRRTTEPASTSPVPRPGTTCSGACRPMAADMPALYERGVAARGRHWTRFASRINRAIPSAQPAARVWLGGDRVGRRRSAIAAAHAGILDAWTPLGPGNIGGRTRVVRFHPTVPTTCFAAGVSGGIWKSDDNGTTWRPTGDGLTNIAVNSLRDRSARPDVMYAGTGEGYFREEIRGTGLPLRGGGIFVTRDGGRPGSSCRDQRRRTFTGSTISSSASPTRAASTRPRAPACGDRTDGGTTWTRLLEVNVRGGCLDLALRPDRSDDVLFASCGSYEQATVYRFPRAADRSRRRSRAARARHGPHLAGDRAVEPGRHLRARRQQRRRARRQLSAGPARRLSHRIAAAPPASWEARVTNDDPTYLNTLLLTNAASAAGTRLQPAAPPARASINMGWYINVIAVDPRDPDRVWAAGVDWFRSDDGGRNWGLASCGGGGMPSYAHVDQHGIAFHPQYDGSGNQIALIGNDGGMYRTSNARAATATGDRAACNGGAAIQVAWKSLNRGYGVTQFYHGTPFPDGTRYLGGTQDNGTMFGSDALGPDGWRPVFGGDGGFSAVQPDADQHLARWSSSGPTSAGPPTAAPPSTAQRTGLDPVVSDMLGPGGQLPVRHAVHARPAPPSASGSAATSCIAATTSARRWTKASSAMPDGGRVSAIAVSPAQQRRRHRPAPTRATSCSRTTEPRSRQRDAASPHAPARRLGDVGRVRSAQRQRDLRHLRQLRRRARVSQHRRRRDLAAASTARQRPACPTSRCIRSSSIRTIRSGSTSAPTSACWCRSTAAARG